MSRTFDITERNKVRQLRDKAHYDEPSVNAILDAGHLAQVAFVTDKLPVIVPMIYGRQERRLLLHGARKARVIRMLEARSPLAVNVTILDALVYARSAFNSSMNYRSVTVYGTPRLITDHNEKISAMKVISEHIMPGRWAELRDPSDREVKMTGVVALDIESASAKISAGMPDDEEDDYELPVWAGIVPLTLSHGVPAKDPVLPDGIPVSPSIRDMSTLET